MRFSLKGDCCVFYFWFFPSMMDKISCGYSVATVKSAPCAVLKSQAEEQKQAQSSTQTSKKEQKPHKKHVWLHKIVKSECHCECFTCFWIKSHKFWFQLRQNEQSQWELFFMEVVNVHPTFKNNTCTDKCVFVRVCVSVWLSCRIKKRGNISIYPWTWWQQDLLLSSCLIKPVTHLYSVKQQSWAGLVCVTRLLWSFQSVGGCTDR